jgi:hypothetical protein
MHAKAKGGWAKLKLFTLYCMTDDRLARWYVITYCAGIGSPSGLVYLQSTGYFAYSRTDRSKIPKHCLAIRAQGLFPMPLATRTQYSRVWSL